MYMCILKNKITNDSTATCTTKRITSNRRLILNVRSSLRNSRRLQTYRNNNKPFNYELKQNELASCM